MLQIVSMPDGVLGQSDVKLIPVPNFLYFLLAKPLD
jgi:hypothetical protein